jgi:hypothetical protein
MDVPTSAKVIATAATISAGDGRRFVVEFIGAPYRRLDRAVSGAAQRVEREYRLTRQSIQSTEQ